MSPNPIMTVVVILVAIFSVGALVREVANDDLTPSSYENHDGALFRRVGDDKMFVAQMRTRWNYRLVPVIFSGNAK